MVTAAVPLHSGRGFEGKRSRLPGGEWLPIGKETTLVGQLSAAPLCVVLPTLKLVDRFLVASFSFLERSEWDRGINGKRATRNEQGIQLKDQHGRSITDLRISI